MGTRRSPDGTAPKAGPVAADRRAAAAAAAAAVAAAAAAAAAAPAASTSLTAAAVVADPARRLPPLFPIFLVKVVQLSANVELGVLHSFVHAKKKSIPQDSLTCP